MRTRFKVILIIFLCIGIYMFSKWDIVNTETINSDENIGNI